jgi:hypothetical protein
LLVVDGQVIDKDLTRDSVENKPNASFLIGVSVGKDETDVQSLSPLFEGSISDFRISSDKTKFDEILSNQVNDMEQASSSQGDSIND